MDYLNGLGRRADEHNALLFAPPGKGGVFTQKAVSWMYGVHILLFSQGNDGFHVEIALHWCHVWATDFVGLICFVSVRLQPVGWTVDCQLQSHTMLSYP